MFLIPTMAAEHLARRLQAAGTIRIVYPALNKERKRHFPDGELYVKISDAAKLHGAHAVVLHSGAPGPNEGLVELELILQTLRELKCRRIDVFFSYFPYGMQDEVFAKGEANVAENLIAKLYEYYKVHTVFILDAHFAGKKWAEQYPIRHVSAVPLLCEAAAKDFGQEILFLSPDKGGKRRTSFQHTRKKRKNSFEIELQSSTRIQRAVKGKTIGVVDDLVETGGTLEKFSDECKKAGAKEIIALITHGVLPQGISRIKKNYKKLYLTNSIDRPEANVDIIPLIASMY